MGVYIEIENDKPIISACAFGEAQKEASESNECLSMSYGIQVLKKALSKRGNRIKKEDAWNIYLANDNLVFLKHLACRNDYSLNRDIGRVYVTMIERILEWMGEYPKWTFFICKVDSHKDIRAQEISDRLAALAAVSGPEMFKWEWLPITIDELDPYVVNERV